MPFVKVHKVCLGDCLGLGDTCSTRLGCTGGGGGGRSKNEERLERRLLIRLLNVVWESVKCHVH